VVRFVHTADWQLGMRRHYLDDDAQSRFAQDRLDAVAEVGRLAAEHGAAFITVAGDAFDDNQVDRRTLLRALEVLRGFPDVPVFLLPANHDPFDAGSVYRSGDFAAHCPRQVQVLTDSSPVEAVAGVDVVGAPWRSKRPTREPAEQALAELEPDGSRLRVLVAHGPCDGLVADAGQAGLLRLSALEEALDQRRIAFAALGDRHSATSVGRTGRIWYAGAPEPTAYVEHNPGKALVVDVDHDRVDVTEHRVGHWTFRQEVIEVAGADDVDRIARWLDEPDDKSRTIAKLAVRGSLTLRDRAHLDDLLADAAARYAAIEGWDRHTELVTTPDDADLDALDVGGFARDAVDELRTVASAGGDDAEAASDALSLLYRLAGRR